MSWRMIGKRASSEISFDRDSASPDYNLRVYPEWGCLSPDLSGPHPILELDELQSLNARELSVVFRRGTEEDVLKEVSAAYRDLGRRDDFTAPEMECLPCFIYCLQDHIEIEMRLEAKALEKIEKKTFATLSYGEHAFWSITLPSRLVVGKYSIGASEENKAAWLAGDLPAMTWGRWSMQFTTGFPMPNPPEEANWLHELRHYF